MSVEHTHSKPIFIALLWTQLTQLTQRLGVNFSISHLFAREMDRIIQNRNTRFTSGSFLSVTYQQKDYAVHDGM